MSEALRRALTNAANALENEARRRRTTINAGADGMQADVKLIRDHVAWLCAMDNASTYAAQNPQGLPFGPCTCPPTHCRGEPNFGQFCKAARAGA